MSNKKLNLFKKRRLRNRNKIKRAKNTRIRMSVHRSSKNIYVQLIDDSIGTTLVSASSRMSVLGKDMKNTKETAKLVGKEIAQRAKKSGISEVYFDRGGFLYHGRVKALADAANNSAVSWSVSFHCLNLCIAALNGAATSLYGTRYEKLLAFHDLSSFCCVTGMRSDAFS